jgi:hypothetical protein
VFVVTGAGAVSIDVAGMRGGLLVGPANCRCSCNPRCGCEGHAKRDARVLAARCANIAGVRRTSTTADDSTNRRREIERGMARPRLDGGAEERGSSCAVPRVEVQKLRRALVTLNGPGIPTHTSGKSRHGFAVNQILKRATNAENPNLGDASL